MRTLQLGPRQLQFPSDEIGQLHDSSHLLANCSGQLQQRLDKDGYLLLRGLLDRDTVIRARTTVMDHLDGRNCTASRKMEGSSGIAVHPDVQAVTEAPQLWDLFRHRLLSGDEEEPCDFLTFRYKWLRAVAQDEFTGAHWDTVYMGRGDTKRLYTVWIPFGDIPVEQGTLAVCPGSHRLSSFARLRETYGRLDVDQDRTEGWFTKDPMEIVEKFGSQWLTANFRMGDVLIFGMHTIHASTTNMTGELRLSCDVRFQPASDRTDPRWVGDACSGHSSHGKEKLKTMEEARREWGL